MENHPLMLMVVGKNKKLLRHPLSLALLRFITNVGWLLVKTYQSNQTIDIDARCLA